MDPLLTALIGLFGALIGAGASVVTIAIQSHHQTRRERMKLIADLAIEDHRIATDLVKANPAGGAVPPLSLYLDYHASIARIVEHRPLEVADIKALGKRIDELYGASPDTRNPRGTKVPPSDAS